MEFREAVRAGDRNSEQADSPSVGEERRGEDLWYGTDRDETGAEDDSWVFGRWIPFMKFKNPTPEHRLPLHSRFS